MTPTNAEQEQLVEPARYAVIVLANVSWGFRTQRPQHIARAFARHGHPVFYLQNGITALGTQTDVGDGIITVDLNPSLPFDHYRKLPIQESIVEWMHVIDHLKWQHGIEEAVIHVHVQSWTPLAWALRNKHGWPVIYDCMDDWESFPGIGKVLLEAERDLVAGCDLVVTTAERLREKWAPHNPRTVVVRNGVDADFFAQHRAAATPLPEFRRPVIGFTGALAAWIDFALIAAVARARPDWTFALVGDVYVPTEELFGLESLNNVHLLGLQPYEMMPAYLSSFDVAIIPFAVDELTAAVDPVKFYEYAASGTPIVATFLPEIAEHRHLFHEGSDAASFERAIEDALSEDPSLAARRVQLAYANTWTQRYVAFDEATRPLWPVLSVIVVTNRQPTTTSTCLAALVRNTSYPTLEVIIRDAEPGGFAAAANQGLAAARGDLLVVLNDDCEVSPRWHASLLRHLADDSVGLVGPRSDNLDSSARIEVPADYPNGLDGFARDLQHARFGESFDAQLLARLAIAMRREVYVAAGPLDEGYDLSLFEDADYCERVRRAGWRVICAHDTFVHRAPPMSAQQPFDSRQHNAMWDQSRERFESLWGTWERHDDRVEPAVGG